ncbi:uncharacterized protein BO95DRAFT_373177 [Aspergillus brunneoviolaceus CBS 621.78]|uniref:Uncharacterized protein n=1 Tax=Aspergillus brunneoviolaceus CBS 621.78 TaxID=1450534 RepID=A0ACD1FWR7_9EURO|nr:hypothetical protein BO95DRAFT_373177 [Aspergillus brunneoviolaceus CBS 621.78]RAH41422.1 hypothetical protein BO95DRAFT_373177 [Aspergillus brunneoviolaceus CBS 621.78]
MSYTVKTVDAAMAEALRHLTQISAYFRDRQNNADVANDIGRLSTMIVIRFSEGIMNVPASDFLLEPQVDDNNQIAVEDQALENSSQPTVAPSSLSEAQREIQRSLVLQQAPMRDRQLLPNGNWARVVGTMPESSTQAQAQAQAQELVQYMSPASLTSSSLSRQSHNSEEEAECRELANAALSLTPHIMQNPTEAKAGVIRIYGKTAREHISFITTRIHEGALQEIRVEADDRTRVTFQLASAAVEFLKSNREMQQLLGYGRFGTGYHVELAEIVDWNDDLRRMNQPIRERRRLSFARKRLFAEGMTPDKWKHDIRQLAGPGAIDFLWVFNSGNATAVFNSTIVARRVLETFENWKNGRNVYSGVSVTYSSDPCEKELALVRESRANMGRGYVKRVIR